MIREKVKKIALIYEGVKTEENLFESIRNNFFVDTAEVMLVTLPADGNIYMLWARLKEDDFDTDLIEVLKEMNQGISEKLKEISVWKRDYNTLYLELSDCRKYKEIVGKRSDYSDYRHISKEMWYIACDASRKRASLLVNYKEQCKYRDFLKNVTQEKLYEVQKKNFIKGNKMIGILNGLPLFLIEYYDESFWNLISAAELKVSGRS